MLVDQNSNMVQYYIFMHKLFDLSPNFYFELCKYSLSVQAQVILTK